MAPSRDKVASVLFTSVYSQQDGGTGIGGFDLKDATDRVFAFDYESTGRPDPVIFYRGRGEGGLVSIPGRSANPDTGLQEGDYNTVWSSIKGIGGFDLKGHGLDQVFAFDFRGTGKNDHICAYRPGEGAISSSDMSKTMTISSHRSLPLDSQNRG